LANWRWSSKDVYDGNYVFAKLGFEETKISEQTVVLILKKRWGAKLELWNGRDRRIARFLKRITGIV
jgi:hypothetical protein